MATWDDELVPAENSIYFYLALRKAKVPAEMHVFLEGHHGFFVAVGVVQQAAFFEQAQGPLQVGVLLLGSEISGDIVQHRYRTRRAALGFV